MEMSYWNRFLLQRLNRRRAVSAAGAVAVAGVVTAACGDDGGGEPKENLGLLTKSVDTTKQAKRGGVLKWAQTTGDPASFDPAFPSGGTNQTVGLAYSRLVKPKMGHLRQPEKSVQPDLAESWEFSPDKLTLTFKLRQAKFHNKPPLNGRAVDVQDVLFSWDRMSKVAVNRASLANSVNPDAPILSVTAPDASTIVMKLKQPHSYILPLVGTPFGGYWIVPKEVDGAIDVRNEVAGSGPYVLTNYTPSLILNYRRHADYYDKDTAFIETIEAPIIPSSNAYATGVSQFRAGAIYEYPIKSEEILALKKEVPELNVFEGSLSNHGYRTGFGWLPEGRSPFIDERVRQAYSLSIDRDAFNDYKYNVSKFESDGLPVETRWNSAITADHEGYWLDPRSKDFGANAKNYQHDVAEAKKLLAAAGYPNGLEVNSYSPFNGITAGKDVEVMDQFATEAGFRVKFVTMDYPTEFLPKFRDGQGKHDGWCSKVGAQANGPPDAIGQLAYLYYSKGGINFYGLGNGDPNVDVQVEKGLVEFDENKRKAIALDLQRHLAQKQYYVNYPGGATGFNIAWPVIGNFNVYRSAGDTMNYAVLTWWIDDTKPPLKKA